MGNPRRANGTRRDKLRARIKARRDECGICHGARGPIDYDGPYKFPDGSQNPLAFVVDEIVPVSKGGSPFEMANCRAAHFICNAERGAKMDYVNAPQKTQRHSRSW